MMKTIQPVDFKIDQHNGEYIRCLFDNKASLWIWNNVLKRYFRTLDNPIIQ